MAGIVLGKGAGALLASGARGLHVSGAVGAVPALTETVQKSGGFLSRIFGGGSTRLSVPLTEPLPGVQEPAYEPPTSAPTTQVTSLPSGLKIASENTPVRKPVSLHDFPRSRTPCSLCMHDAHGFRAKACWPCGP
jgi:hypothetical protein